MYLRRSSGCESMLKLAFRRADARAHLPPPLLPGVAPAPFIVIHTKHFTQQSTFEENPDPSACPLPVELILCIIEEFNDTATQAQLARLALVSKLFCSWLTPLLYHTVSTGTTSVSPQLRRTIDRSPMIARFVKSLILTSLDPNIDWYTERCPNLTHITVSPREVEGNITLRSLSYSANRIVQRYPVSTSGAQLTSLSFPSATLLCSAENIPTTVTHITFLGLVCDSGVDRYNIEWTNSLRPLIGHVTHIAICIRDFNWRASSQLATLIMQCGKVLSYATLIVFVIVPVPAFIPEEALPDIARIGDAAGRRTVVFLLEQPFAEYSMFEPVICVERTRGSRGSFMGWERGLHGEDDLWTRAQRIIDGKIHPSRRPPSSNYTARIPVY